MITTSYSFSPHVILIQEDNKKSKEHELKSGKEWESNQNKMMTVIIILILLLILSTEVVLLLVFYSLFSSIARTIIITVITESLWGSSNERECFKTWNLYSQYNDVLHTEDKEDNLHKKSLPVKKKRMITRGKWVAPAASSSFAWWFHLKDEHISLWRLLVYGVWKWCNIIHSLNHFFTHRRIERLPW